MTGPEKAPARSAVLFATTFWSFPREFSSLTPAAIRNGPAGATIRSTSDESTSVRVTLVVECARRDAQRNRRW